METKQIKIEVPSGYEIDKDKSNFENIIFKPIKAKLPLSVNELPNRKYFISSSGQIITTPISPSKNHLSTEKRARAFLALMQLVELRDAWNEGWKADWTDNSQKYCIFVAENKVEIVDWISYGRTLHFKTQKLAKKFLEQFEDLIEEAQELL